MTKEEAIEFTKAIKGLCDKYGAYRVQTYENKPHLKMIKFDISAKIDPDKPRG